MIQSPPKIAVLLPCYNEGIAIAGVVQSFKKFLPQADIYVYDNNSTDDTIQRAQEAGAIVRLEPRQGKGHVVRRMFSDIEADIYVMADGDETYDASKAPQLIDLLVSKQLDMVVGTRDPVGKEAHRPGHAFGNVLFNLALKLAFGSRFQDVFSGYRVFSRRFVKSFPALSHGFDIETELSVHCLEMNLPAEEVPTPFYERPLGSSSKLSTVKDGIKISMRILILLREVRPLFFFGCLFAKCAFLSLLLGWPILQTFLSTGLVPKLPSAVLATGLMLLGFFSLFTGMILNSLTHHRREMKRLFYLNVLK